MPVRRSLLLLVVAACSKGDDIPSPSIASIVPSHAGVGASVTIEGTDFCAQPEPGDPDVDPLACAETGSVTFGTVPATQSSYGETSIVVQVPDGVSGVVSVRVAVAGRISNAIDFTVDR